MVLKLVLSDVDEEDLLGKFRFLELFFGSLGKLTPKNTNLRKKPRFYPHLLRNDGSMAQEVKKMLYFFRLP
jgi:hypothetical protein